MQDRALPSQRRLRLRELLGARFQLFDHPLHPRRELLETGKTDLLRGFVSSRTKRKFSAFLVRGDDGKVGFEFEKKEPKATKAPAEKKPAARKKAASE